MAPRRIARALHEPLGGFRAGLCWRVFGFALYQVSPLTVGPLSIAGLVLVGFGPRVWTLAAALFGAGAALSRLASPAERGAIPEEFGVFVALPAFALVVTFWKLVSARKRIAASSASGLPVALQAEIEALHLGAMRIGAVAAMGFSAFHKLNADFFVSDTSCTTLLGQNLDALWAVPIDRLGLLPTPPVVVLGEGLSALLLLVYPLVGIAFTVAIMTPVALFGPTALTTVVYAMSFGFLREADGRSLRDGLSRYRSWLVGVLVAVGVSVQWLHLGVQHFRFTLYLVFVAAVVCALAWLLGQRWRAASGFAALLVPARSALSLSRPSRAALGAFALLALLNGLSPYFGSKYRLSMAMFSNLRVDDVRWNHFVVPGAIRVREFDPHVRVTRVDLDAAARRGQATLRRRHERALEPGLFTPTSLETRVAALRRAGGRADVELHYSGRARVFEDVARSPALARWLADLPRSKWFQPALALDGSQPCVH